MTNTEIGLTVVLILLLCIILLCVLFAFCALRFCKKLLDETATDKRKLLGGKLGIADDLLQSGNGSSIQGQELLGGKLGIADDLLQSGNDSSIQGQELLGDKLGIADDSLQSDHGNIVSLTELRKRRLDRFGGKEVSSIPKTNLFESKMLTLGDVIQNQDKTA